MFRIEKGILDVNDTDVNEHFSPDELRVPFRNMVYIGDSDTDIPCMKLVNAYGGHSIGVYDPETKDKQKVYKMMKDNRIKYFMPADYSENTEMDKLVKAIIDRTATNELLEGIYYERKKEVMTAEKNDKRNDADRTKDSLITKLKNSRSFAKTHWLIKQLGAYEEWSEKQKEEIFSALLDNMQVSGIVKDEDVSAFYKRLLEGCADMTESAKKAQKLISE